MVCVTIETLRSDNDEALWVLVCITMPILWNVISGASDRPRKRKRKKERHWGEERKIRWKRRGNATRTKQRRGAEMSSPMPKRQIRSKPPRVPRRARKRVVSPRNSNTGKRGKEGETLSKVKVSSVSISLPCGCFAGKKLIHGRPFGLNIII